MFKDQKFTSFVLYTISSTLEYISFKENTNLATLFDLCTTHLFKKKIQGYVSGNNLKIEGVPLQ